MKIWKKIPNFDRYECSSDGEIRSLNYKNSGKIKILKPALSDDGYFKTVLLRNDGKYKTITVHRMITLSFLGKRQKGKEVNHVDGNKQNNHISNLEYVTRSENMKHAFRMNLIQPLKGAANGSAKLTEKDVISIRKYVKNFNGRYYGRKALAEKYGISEAHVKDLISRRRGVWNHI